MRPRMTTLPKCPWGERFICILGRRYLEDGGKIHLVGQCTCCEKVTPYDPLLLRIAALRSSLELIAKMPHAGARHIARQALERDQPNDDGEYSEYQHPA